MALKLKFQHLVTTIILYGCGIVLGAPQVPCYFIFGDSLFDNGNNNNLLTLAKVNFSPYGVDFPIGPTGRFTNGRTIVDFTAELLGFKNFIPPFAAATEKDLISGVNYASGAGGIRSESGRELGSRLSLDDQLRNHETAMSKMMFRLFKSTVKTNDHLNKCLYSVGMGNNDYINNYYMPELFQTSRMLAPEAYATALIQQYSQQIKTLHGYGARKVVLYGLGPIGCVPFEILKYGRGNGPCVDEINLSIQLFNKKLIALVDELNNLFTDSKFIYINLYDSTMELIANPAPYGIKVLDVACCGLGKNNARIQCLPLLTPCVRRNEYLFWDGFHLTEVAYKSAAARSYKASRPTDAYPFDIEHLLQHNVSSTI